MTKGKKPVGKGYRYNGSHNPTFSARVPTDVAEAIHQQAVRSNLHFSAVVRAMLTRAVRKEKPEPLVYREATTDRHTKMVKVFLTPAQHAAYMEKCGRLNTNASTLARELLLQDIQKEQGT